MRANEIERFEPEEDDLFEMANLYPRDTGLPMTVWVSPKGHARHDVRIKVCQTPGDQMNADDTAVMALRPKPHLLHGQLPSRELAMVRQWAELNSEPLVNYWDGALSTLELARLLRKVE